MSDLSSLVTQWKDRVVLQKWTGLFFNIPAKSKRYWIFAVRIFPLCFSLQDEAPKTAQEWRRELPAEVPRDDAPLPPPAETPVENDPTIVEPDLVVEEKSAPAPKPIEPGVEHVGIFKHHCKVTLEGQSRKFLHKTFLSENSALIAAAEFRRRCLNVLGMFDGLKRAPHDRHELLVHYGPWYCTETFCGLQNQFAIRFCITGILEMSHGLMNIFNF